jgi:peptide chain release factor 3
VEEAWPGDIVGLLDTSGEFRIGDTLSERKGLEFEGVPRFSPEFFSSVSSFDPLKRKQFKKGLEQLIEEGVIQMFIRPNSGDTAVILGAVGALQFEVLEYRMRDEYNVEMKLERLPYLKACWVSGEGVEFDEFNRYGDTLYVTDRESNPVVLFKTEWGVNWAKDKYKTLTFKNEAPL